MFPVLIFKTVWMLKVKALINAVDGFQAADFFNQENSFAAPGSSQKNGKFSIRTELSQKKERHFSLFSGGWF